MAEPQTGGDDGWSDEARV